MTIFSFQYPKSARQFVVLSLSDLLPQNIDHVIQKWLEWLLFGQQGQTFFFDPQVPLAQLKGQVLLVQLRLFQVELLFLVLLLLQVVRQNLLEPLRWEKSYQ
jgi:hypothetical protein